MDDLIQDLRFRVLARKPGFTSMAALTLALGIGANAAIFSVVKGVVLEPVPFEAPDRLVLVWETVQRENLEIRSASYPDFLDWREQNTVFGCLRCSLLIKQPFFDRGCFRHQLLPTNT